MSYSPPSSARAILAGWGLDDSLAEKLARTMDPLRQANSLTNLFSVQDDETLYFHHLLDSLAPLMDSVLRNRTQARVLDLGAGGGFPTIPLALAQPSWRIVSLDSVRKKMDALGSLCQNLRLTQVTPLWGRAEEMGRLSEHREKYDFGFARAVGGFSLILELALPFLKVGGSLYLHRGASGAEEPQEAQSALGHLGAKVGGQWAYHLPGLTQPRFIVRVDKTSPTSDRYPRRTGIPAKRPL